MRGIKKILHSRNKDESSETPTEAGSSANPSVQASEEKYGLFEFPPRSTAESNVASLIPSEDGPKPRNEVDIIAVHGLGGHWKTTWLAGGSDGDPIWLRDRLAPTLQHAGIGARILSYGYDSAVVFTKSVSEIDHAATELLGRLRGRRKAKEQKDVPIVFIAHSLGGLVVKKAMAVAWSNYPYYGEILDKITGCLFLGVPHQGSDLAYWAKFPARILPYVSLGFAGNPRFLELLETNSKEWMQISKDFVHRASKLSIRTFFETEKLGDVIVVNEHSARMGLPNELASSSTGSNHRTICKFSDLENQRYEPIGDAVEELVRLALSGDEDDIDHAFDRARLPIPNVAPQWQVQLDICSDLPLTTDTFCGRETELLVVEEALSSSRSGLRGVVLYGIGGSGKTQLTLRYIQKHKNEYPTIIWINASSSESTYQSFEDVANLFSQSWPARDVPNPYSGTENWAKVVSRLRSTLYTRWLLVIDSIDDLDQEPFRRYVPACSHGSVIITSTQYQCVDAFPSFTGIEVDGLDLKSAQELLLNRAFGEPQPRNLLEKDLDTGSDIAMKLHRLPLALEQAGALLKSSFSLSEFIPAYQNHYTLLMSQVPPRGVVTYEKARSVTTIFSMLYDALKKRSPEAAAILDFIALLGPWNIPISLMRQMNLDRTVFGDFSDEASSALARAFEDQVVLSLALGELTKICLVKLDRVSEVFSLHRAVGMWCLEQGVGLRQSWILLAADVVATAASDPLRNIPASQLIDRSLLAPLYRCITRVHGLLPADFLDLPGGPLYPAYARIAGKLARVYLHDRKPKDAKTYFSIAIDFERTKEGDNWPGDEYSLLLLEGLAMTYHKLRDLENASDAFEAAVSLSGKLFGNTHRRSISLSNLQKAVLERSERMLEHHKSTLVASTDCRPKSYEGQPIASSQLSIEMLEGIGSSAGARLEETVDEMNSQLKTNIGSDLLIAASNGDAQFVKSLLKLDQVDVNVKDSSGRTPLYCAVIGDHLAVAEMLLERSDVDPDSTNNQGQPPLSWAAMFGYEAMVRLLLKRANANTFSKDMLGLTPLHYARYHRSRAILQLILEHLICLNKDNPDTLDYIFSFNNIAFVESNYEVAELILREVRASYAGSHTRNTYAATNCTRFLGISLCNQGKYEEGETMLKEALVSCTEAVGKDHPYTLRCALDVGRILKIRCKNKESELILREALEGFMKMPLGGYLNNLAECFHEIGIVLQRQMKIDEAQAMFKQELEMRQRMPERDKSP